VHTSSTLPRALSNLPKFVESVATRGSAPVYSHIALGQWLITFKETIFDDLTIIEKARDPHDSWLLALAEASRANFLVTGDSRAGILDRRSVAQAEVLTANDFCQRLGI